LQVVTDLVQGEFMQLGSKETENERFAHYLTKTYRKTASLIANTVKSVRIVYHWHKAYSVSQNLRCSDVLE
jgi:decaprenyl-diphosphate synthase subunit 1